MKHIINILTIFSLLLSFQPQLMAIDPRTPETLSYDVIKGQLSEETMQGQLDRAKNGKLKKEEMNVLIQAICLSIQDRYSKELKDSSVELQQLDSTEKAKKIKEVEDLKIGLEFFCNGNIKVFVNTGLGVYTWGTPYYSANDKDTQTQYKSTIALLDKIIKLLTPKQPADDNNNTQAGIPSTVGQPSNLVINNGSNINHKEKLPNNNSSSENGSFFDKIKVLFYNFQNGTMKLLSKGSDVIPTIYNPNKDELTTKTQQPPLVKTEPTPGIRFIWLNNTKNSSLGFTVEFDKDTGVNSDQFQAPQAPEGSHLVGAIEIETNMKTPDTHLPGKFKIKDQNGNYATIDGTSEFKIARTIGVRTFSVHFSDKDGAKYTMSVRMDVVKKNPDDKKSTIENQTGYKVSMMKVTKK